MEYKKKNQARLVSKATAFFSSGLPSLHLEALEHFCYT